MSASNMQETTPPKVDDFSIGSLKLRAADELKRSNGKLWLVACRSGASEIRLQYCELRDQRCWSFLDRERTLFLPFVEFRGFWDVSHKDHGIFDLIAGTTADARADELTNFTKFAKDASAAFRASPPSGVRSLGGSLPESVWVAVLMFFRSSAEHALAKGRCLVTTDPWAATLAA